MCWRFNASQLKGRKFGAHRRRADPGTQKIQQTGLVPEGLRPGSSGASWEGSSSLWELPVSASPASVPWPS